MNQIFMVRTLLDDIKSGKLGPFLHLIFFFQKMVASPQIRAPWKVDDQQPEAFLYVSLLSIVPVHKAKCSITVIKFYNLESYK